MRKTTKSLGAALALAMLLTALPAIAAEGRIPLWQPISILPGMEGQYIVTRNIQANPGMPIIDIQPGTVAVEIDLNGFTLYANGAPAIQAAGVDSLIIRNGTVMYGIPENIRVGMPGDPQSTSRKVVIEDVKVQFAEGDGIALYGVANFALRRNLVVSAGNNGVLIDGTVSPVDPPTPSTGTILDNIVRDCGIGIVMYNTQSVGVVLNRIENTLAGAGIFVGPGPNGFIGCLSCQINENTIEECAGRGLDLNHFESSKVYNNTVTFARADGIYLDPLSQDNLILDNVSSQNFVNGMLIDAPQNHIERNVLNTNGLSGFGFGLWMNGPANTFRGNTAQGNVGPAPTCPGIPPTNDLCDATGGANNSPVDNFMPGLI